MIKEFKAKNPEFKINIDKNMDHKLDDDEINDAFDQADLNNDNELSYNELIS